MKNAIKSIALIFLILLATGCGNSENQEKEGVKLGDYSSAESKPEVKEKDGEGAMDLSNKGIGPVSSLELQESINEEMAMEGQDVFKKMCSACHKMDKKFIGPALSGVSERRSPEWIMNMILNPEEMIAKDPIAKQLVLESNMAVMANQNLSEEEARAVLEYFRSNDH